LSNKSGKYKKRVNLLKYLSLRSNFALIDKLRDDLKNVGGDVGKKYWKNWKKL
jgi:hypothetical protein